MPLFMRDGFQATGYINEEDGLYEAFSFNFRPPLPEDDETFIQQYSKLQEDDGKKSYLYLLDYLARCLVRLDQIDGKPTKEDLRHMHARAVFRMSRVIRGIDPSDPKPSDPSAPATLPVDIIGHLKN